MSIANAATPRTTMTMPLSGIPDATPQRNTLVVPQSSMDLRHKSLFEEIDQLERAWNLDEDVNGLLASNKAMHNANQANHDCVEKFAKLVEQTHEEIKQHLNNSIQQLLEGLRELGENEQSGSEQRPHKGHAQSSRLSNYPAMTKQSSQNSNKSLLTSASQREAKHAKQKWNGEQQLKQKLTQEKDAEVSASSDKFDIQQSDNAQQRQSETSNAWVSEDAQVRISAQSDVHFFIADGTDSKPLMCLKKSESKESESILFEVLDVWQQNVKQIAAKMGLRHESDFREPKISGRENNTIDAGKQIRQSSNKVVRQEGLWFKIVMDPQSRQRFIWEMMSIVLVLYDIIWLPFLLLEPPETPFSRAMSWLCRLFWTFDIPMNLITGYLTPSGVVEYQPFPIAKHYIKGWCSLDVLVVGVDWMELVVDEAKGGGFARIGRMGRFFRMVRMVRLLRILRLQRILMHMLDEFRSEWIKELSVLFKILLVICGSGHLFACIWYGIGVRDDEPHNWVSTTFITRHTLGYRYATSLHWSLAQFSGGLDFVEPQNLLERTYAVGTWIFAFTLGAIMISALTSSWTQLNLLANDKTMKMTILRKYLTDHKISYKLANRVRSNAQHALQEMERQRPEHTVELLQLVSTPLRMELHFELYFPVLRGHPFFERCGLVATGVMKKVCHVALSTMLVSRGDVIFSVGEIPTKPKMVFVLSGRLKYLNMAHVAPDAIKEDQTPEDLLMTAVPTGRSSIVSESEYSVLSSESESEDVPGTTSDLLLHQCKRLLPGDWIAEPFLWTHWMCRGVLAASTNSQLVLVDVQSFQEIVSAFYDESFNPRIYATEFVRVLNEKVTDLSDITNEIGSQAMSKLNDFMIQKRHAKKFGSSVLPTSSD